MRGGGALPLVYRLWQYRQRTGYTPDQVRALDPRDLALDLHLMALEDEARQPPL